MKSDSQLMFKIADLTLRSLNGTLDPQGLQSLEDLLINNPLAAEYYMEVLWTHVGLNSMEGIFCLQESNPAFNQDLWKSLLEEEKTAAAVEISKDCKIVEPEKNEVLQNPRKTNKSSLFVAISSIAALTLLITFLHFNSYLAQQEVATLIDGINARWAEGTPTLNSGYRFSSPCDSMQLLGGIVKIKYDQGVELVVEGPAKFDFLSPSQYGLSYGKVYAHVNPEGRGFTVVTSNSSIIDLGTEFGIQRNIEGVTDVHVFKGKTSLLSGQQNKSEQLVIRGQAKRVSSDNNNVLDIDISERQFIRDISSKDNMVWRGEPLSMISLVSGGNGIAGGNSQRGIDPGSGTVHESAVQTWNRIGEQKYRRLNGQLYIDGVFVPNGKQGKVAVTSMGHTFDEFPETDKSYYWADISSAARGIESENDSKLNRISSLTLNGMAIGGNAGHNALLIHPNAGITFDLSAIRKALPKLDQIRFKTLCGIADNSSHVQAKADFWILVDGKCEFHYRSEGSAAALRDVDIVIGPNQRFLTLATTDGGDSIQLDWCLFVNPVLELASE